MQPRRIIILLALGIAGAGIVLGGLYLFGDRPDESRRTGTQLQLTPEDKAAIEDMRRVMKDR